MRLANGVPRSTASARALSSHPFFSRFSTMPSWLGRSLMLLTLLAGMSVLGACATGGEDGDASVDTGPDVRDTGPDTPPPVRCGADGQTCCGGSGCNSGLVCGGGRCERPSGCGTDGQLCCAGESCVTGFLCLGGRCERQNACGAGEQLCCTDTDGGKVCQSALVCASDVCLNVVGNDCGGTNQSCCDGANCASGLSCMSGRCVGGTSCGSRNESCCGGDECGDGLTCQRGLCLAQGDLCGDLNQACCTTGGATPCNGIGTCCAERCVDLRSNKEHCGACEMPCADPGTCVNNMCMANCGGEGDDCCEGAEPCTAGFECRDNACRRPLTCDGPSTPCSRVTDCCLGLNCRARPDGQELCCQEAGQSCTMATDCCGQMNCSGGACLRRGEGESCIEDADCNTADRFGCYGGRCRNRDSDTCLPSDDDCADCLDEANCGWCPGSNVCVTKNAAGTDPMTPEPGCGAFVGDATMCGG